MNEFLRIIKEWLENECNSDPYLKEKYDESKINECEKYIYSAVQKSGRAGFADSEIYQMAKDFYIDGLTAESSPSAKVVVNHSIELTDEEKQSAREKALKQYERDELVKLKKKEETEQAKAKKVEIREQVKANIIKEKYGEQLDLFGGDF